jgi:hypothetical protein
MHTKKAVKKLHLSKSESKRIRSTERTSTVQGNTRTFADTYIHTWRDPSFWMQILKKSKFASLTMAEKYQAYIYAYTHT